MAIEREVTRAVKTGKIDKVREILDGYGTQKSTLSENANEILVGNPHMRAYFAYSDIALYKTLPIGTAIIMGYDEIAALLINFVMQHAERKYMRPIQQIHMPIYSDLALTSKRVEVIKLLFRPEFGINTSGIGTIKPLLEHAEQLLTQAIQKRQDESAYSQIVEFLKNPYHRTESISQNIVPNVSAPITKTQANPSHVQEEKEKELVEQEVVQIAPTQTFVTISSSSPTLTAVEYDNAAQSLEQKIKELETNMLQRLNIKILFSLASSDYKINKLEEYVKLMLPREDRLVREKHVASQIQNIMDNPYQKAFYDTLQWELTGCYLSALLISSGKIPPSNTGILGKCGKLVKIGGNFVPIAGSLMKLMGSIMLHLDSNNQQKIFEHYKYLSSNLNEVSKIIEQFARELAIDPNFIITQNDGGIFGKIKDGLFSSIVELVENLSTDDIANMVEGTISAVKQNFVEYSIKEVAGVMSEDSKNEIKKGEVAAQIVAGIIHSKILSITSGDMLGTIDDKVALLKGWVSSFERPDITIEQSIAEAVLEHLKHEKVIKKCWKENKNLEQDFVDKLAAHIHKVGVSQIFIPSLYEFSKKCINVQKQFMCFGKEITSIDQEFSKQFDDSPQPEGEEARNIDDDLFHNSSSTHLQYEQENISEQDHTKLLGDSKSAH